MLREFLKQFSEFGRRSWAALPLLAFAALQTGCGPGEEVALERVRVSGQVLLDGEPLQAGAIVFKSADHGTGEAVVAHGFVKEGVYSIDAADGPVVGTAQVSFLPKPLDREEYEAKLDEARRSRRKIEPTVVEIPEQYSGQSELTVQLVGGKENRIDFQLDSQS
jgi:hypothetical protein